MRALMWVMCLVLSGAATARADDGDLELARKRFEMGRLLHQRGRYKEALVELEAARALVPRPEFDYNIGLCLARLDRPAEAADALERFIEARPEDPEAGEIWRKIATLRAEGLRRKQAVKPPAPESKTLPQTRTQAQTQSPPPPPAGIASAPPPSSVAARPRFLHTAQGRATLGLTAGAAALLLTAAVTGALAIDGRSGYDAGCDRGLCDAAAYDRMHALAITTDVLIGVGAAAAVGAIVLVATRPRPRAYSVVPLVGSAAGLAVQGAF